MEEVSIAQIGKSKAQLFEEICSVTEQVGVRVRI